jgi:REP element-mobilizing transposase RayT
VDGDAPFGGTLGVMNRAPTPPNTRTTTHQAKRTTLTPIPFHGSDIYMGFNKDVHRRRSIRLQGYDYSQPNAYFVTICTYQKKCLFGEVVGGDMRLNEIGKIVEKEWNNLPERFKSIELDESIIMPNHFHGIIWIVDDPNFRVGAQFIAPSPMRRSMDGDAPAGGTLGAMNCAPTMTDGAMNRAPTLGDVMRVFKAKAAYHIHRDGFMINVWQRNYYERVIRSERELDAIRKYIAENPLKWNEDPERQPVAFCHIP